MEERTSPASSSFQGVVRVRSVTNEIAAAARIARSSAKDRPGAVIEMNGWRVMTISDVPGVTKFSMEGAAAAPMNNAAIITTRRWSLNGRIPEAAAKPIVTR